MSAYKFGVNVSDQVAIPSNAAWDLLATWTAIAWVYPTTITSGKNLFNRGQASSNNRHMNIFMTGTGGTAWGTTIDRATTDLTYRTADNTIVLNQWQCVAHVFDQNAAANNLVTMYAGILGSPLRTTTPGLTTDGSGAYQTDAGVAMTIANNQAGIAALPGLISSFVLSSAALTSLEVNQWAKRPSANVRGCLGFWLFSGSQVRDLSGNGNNGLITGAIPTGGIVPGVRPTRYA